MIWDMTNIVVAPPHIMINSLASISTYLLHFKEKEKCVVAVVIGSFDRIEFTIGNWNLQNYSIIKIAPVCHFALVRRQS